MFSDSYAASRSGTALRRAIFGFDAALRICPTDAEIPLFNQELLETLVSNLSPQSHEAFIGGLETFAFDMLDRARVARTNGSDIVEAPLTIDIGDPQVRDALHIFNMEHWTTLGQLPVEHYTLEAILVSIASTFEAFCNQVMCTLFIRHPQSIPGNPKFSLDLALRSSDLRELVLRACESEARAKISGPIDAWLRYLHERIGLPLPKKLKDWPTSWLNVCRVFAMRNCLVHRGGVVDSMFIDSMSRYGLPAGKEYDRLQMSPGSIRNGVLSACSVATDLYMMAEVTQANRDQRSRVAEQALRHITDIQWYLVGSGQPQLAKCMDCTKNIESGQATIHHVSSWTARYFCGEIDQVRQEVEEQKWSEGEYYQLHRAALSGNKVDVQRIVQNAFDKRNISALGIAHSPQYSLIKTYLDAPST